MSGLRTFILRGNPAMRPSRRPSEWRDRHPANASRVIGYTHEPSAKRVVTAGYQRLGWPWRGAPQHDGVVKVEAINIGPRDQLAPVESVRAVAGQGLEGDRHFHRDGAEPGQALTLIEAEVLEDVRLTGLQSRRQVVVRGIRLNDLVGKRFRVGDVDCFGVEICEPCLHLQGLTRPGIIRDLLHRGGINVDILCDGQISVGDPVVVD